jgi:hypothetical protein
VELAERRVTGGRDVGHRDSLQLGIVPRFFLANGGRVFARLF